MLFTDNFASTAAQIIPVLAFAVLVEMGRLYRQGSKPIEAPELLPTPMPPTPEEERFQEVLVWLIALAIYIGFLITAVNAELACLDVLAGAPPAHSSGYVRGTIKFGLILLLVIPAMSLVQRLSFRSVRQLVNRIRGQAAE